MVSDSLWPFHELNLPTALMLQLNLASGIARRPPADFFPPTFCTSPTFPRFSEICYFSQFFLSSPTGGRPGIVISFWIASMITNSFLQGYGLMAKEEVVFDARGGLTTRGALAYRIPRCTDIPGELNVHLLKDSPNPRAVIHSSKVRTNPALCGLMDEKFGWFQAAQLKLQQATVQSLLSQMKTRTSPNHLASPCGLDAD